MKRRNHFRRWKYPKQYHPRAWPEPHWIETAAQYNAHCDGNGFPRRHEKYITLNYWDMERPVGRVSEKNWERVRSYLKKAQNDIFSAIATWPRRRIPRCRPPPRDCQTRGWTWSRSLPTKPAATARRRLYLPRWLLPDPAAPQGVLYLTDLWEGRPCSREPEDGTVTRRVG
ncbi:MAG: hypothetical protein LUC93_07735 [Planctomycetaceae bacterium]|nr:hypothetical protein [Planctomycetaceae bacterium]